MEEEFRATLSEQGYVHEILADFGSQETGVFDKDKLDKAMKFKSYAYSELTYSQRERVEEDNISVEMLIPSPDMNVGIYKPTVFRTMGIDWDALLRLVPPIRDDWAITKLIAGTPLELDLLRIIYK